MTDLLKNSNKKWLLPTAHVLGWILFFAIPIFMRDNHDHHFGPPNRPPEEDTNMRWLSFITNVMFIIIFYVNIFFISPIFTKERQYGKYLLIQAFAATGFYFFMKSLTVTLFADNHHLPVGIQMFVYFVVLLTTLCYSLVQENIRVERLQKEKENEALRSELSFLRWQISPHFLFNVLNNMVSLAHIKSEKLEGMLLNLSSLMRYMLYETDDRKVAVEKEVEYLNSYIALQSVRFGSEVKIQADINVSNDCNDCSLEPMLLIPFIENAFKHGIGNVTNPEIDIAIQFSKGKISMTAKNKFAPQPAHLNDETHGIGLANVQRRLNLLYKNRHTLHINATEGWYIVTLNINIT